jgi:hypothetical protein
MKRLNRFLFPILLLVCAVMAPALPGCATFGSGTSTLNKVATAVQDGTLILDSIETFVNSFLALNPNPSLSSKISVDLARARAALATAQQATSAIKDLKQGDIDAAFAAFETAYSDLLALVAPLGVGTVTVVPVDGGVGVRADLGVRFSVPGPRALVPKI